MMIQRRLIFGLSGLLLTTILSAQFTASGSTLYHLGGSVGIGTNAPGATLSIVGNGNDFHIMPESNSSGTLLHSGQALNLIFNSNNVGNDYLTIRAHGNTLAFSTELIRVDGNGRLGIATTSPQSLLHISGGDRSAFRLYKQGNTSNYLSMWQGNSAAVIDAIGTGSLYLGGYDLATNVIMARSGGNVGIGTTTPSEKLDLHDGAMELMQTTGNLDNTKGAIKFGENNTRLFTIQYDGSLSSPNNKLKIRASTGTDDNYTYDLMTFTQNGQIGIGTTSPSNKLEVNGTIRSKKVKVEAGPWPDYVFANGYQPMDISQLEEYIKKHKHLPEVPSAKEVEENGLDLGEMDATLLKKVEELTLYLIDFKKENENLKTENAELRKRLGKVEALLGELIKE